MNTDIRELSSEETMMVSGGEKPWTEFNFGYGVSLWIFDGGGMMGFVDEPNGKTRSELIERAY